MSQSPVSETRHLQGWIHAPVVDGADELEALQTRFLSRLDTDVYETPATFHLTLFPCVHFPQTRYKDVAEVVDNLDIQLEASVTGLRLFPTPESPAVVFVDVAMPTRPPREQIRETIFEVEGGIPTDPDPPHITLFKTNTESHPERSLQLPINDLEKLKRFRDEVKPFTVRFGQPELRT